MMTRSHPIGNRRGTVAVAVLLVLLLTSLFVIGLVSGAARDQDLSGRRMETVRAFYAAEAGINMAMREFSVGADEDGDGEDDSTDLCPETSASEVVDAAGCSQFQFCTRIKLTTNPFRTCDGADWRNNQPGDPNPGDCDSGKVNILKVCVPTPS